MMQNSRFRRHITLSVHSFMPHTPLCMDGTMAGGAQSQANRLPSSRSPLSFRDPISRPLPETTTSEDRPHQQKPLCALQPTTRNVWQSKFTDAKLHFYPHGDGIRLPCDVLSSSSHV